jgi:hypothetical protein
MLCVHFGGAWQSLLEHHVEQDVVDKYRMEVNLFGNFCCRAPISTSIWICQDIGSQTLL